MGLRQMKQTTAPKPEPRSFGWREILGNALSGQYAIDHSLERYFDYLERAQCLP